MVMKSDHEEVETNAARGGDTPHVARYVLMFSTSLVVIAFAVLLIIWG
jgi:hypothetical protein